jgi:two-component system OmpR family sensor kinase
MTSIRRQLLLWLLIGLSLSTIVAAFAVYARAREEARELFDYQLQQMAAAFPHEGFGPVTAPPRDESTMGDVVVVQIWGENGAQLYLSRPGSAAPQRMDIGFSTVATPDGSWRVFSALIGNNIVQVSQPMIFREELAASMALRTMLPLLITLPLLIAFFWVTVGRGLKPLNEVAADVSSRSADALQPLPDSGLPSEVKPLVAALNNLLLRLGRSLRSQRALIADAAHELRTPLTAVKLQIQLAERAVTDAERAAAFAQLKGGTERAIHLVAQLLTLARNEPEAAAQPFTPVDLTDVARQVVAEQAPIAEAKYLELGLSSAAPLRIMGDPEALRTMLSNLVINAIHYAPSGGSVDVEVRIKDGQACLVVTDTGPGIPPAERERVFDRFYRYNTAGVTGSGLGLAIVRKVAERHRASIELGAGPDDRGLTVCVRFPKE